MQFNAQSDLKFVDDFYQSPDGKLFRQQEVKKILPFSDAWFERNRVYGRGVRFIKIGRSIFYRKKDILEFINSHASVSSTSQYSEGG